MHLLIYTQKRDKPLAVRLSLPLALLGALLLALLLGTVVFLGLETRELRIELYSLGRQQDRIAAQLDSSAARLASLGQSLRLAESVETPLAADSVSISAQASGNDRAEPAATIGEGVFFAVQLSAHRTRNEAERAARSLGALLSREVGVKAVELPSGTWYRVMVHPFPTMERARLFADSLRSRNLVSEFFIHRLHAAGAAGSME